MFLLQNSMFILACSLRQSGGAGASSCSRRPGEAPTSAAQKRSRRGDETMFLPNDSVGGAPVRARRDGWHVQRTLTPARSE